MCAVCALLTSLSAMSSMRCLFYGAVRACALEEGQKKIEAHSKRGAKSQRKGRGEKRGTRFLGRAGKRQVNGCRVNDRGRMDGSDRATRCEKKKEGRRRTEGRTRPRRESGVLSLLPDPTEQKSGLCNALIPDNPS